LFNQLEYVVLGSLVIALLTFIILQKRKKKSKILKGSEVDTDEQDNLLSKYEELQKKILVLSSQLSSLDQLNAKVASLDSLKTDLTAINSFEGNDILFCPVTNEPMRRITVEGEDIDVSSKGCWFDAGELLSILDRSDNFLAQLKSYISRNSDSIKIIESSIDKQN